MNKRVTAGAALFAAIAIASPMIAWSASDSGAQSAPTAQAAPDHPGMGPRGGAMGEHHGWMRRMMMHRMMTRLSPPQRCEERLARRAGMIAYTAAKLNLTEQQRPLWDKLNGLLQTAADKERQLCTAMKPAKEGSPATILDRVGWREQFLSARLDGLRQVRPALEQFYQALTAEQKAIIDHPFRRG